MVETALFVRLEAKPGKEAEVEAFCAGGFRSSRKSPRRWRGSEYALGADNVRNFRRFFRMRQGGRLISREKSRQR